MTEASGQGMILAAGYGTRLAPVTDHVPKPLLPVGGIPLLDRIVSAFDVAGIDAIAVNTHHLGEQVAAHLAGRPDADRFTVFAESEILGTGGALDGAREFLDRSPWFLLHNGDVSTEVDLAGLVAAHRTGGALATLLLVDWPEVNSVLLGPTGEIVSLAGRPSVLGEPAAGTRALTYTGIGVFSSALLEDIGPGFSSLIDPLVRALERDPQSVRGHAPAAISWSDLGTLPRYLAAQEPGPEPARRRQGPASLTHITGHGSDRRFWRIAAGNWSAVAMTSPADDQEFERFVAIGEFLSGQGLGAPGILSRDLAARTVLMEDLGVDTLYARSIAGPVSGAATLEAYDAVVDHLLALQDATSAARTQCPEAVDRVLGEDVLRWETDYFRENFLIRHCGLALVDGPALADEFHALARAVARQPLVLLHRDFQSQNIHFQGRRVRLVDFQGLRLGPLGYDIMSLIMDPYVDLGPAVQEMLLQRFADRCAERHGLLAEEVRAMALTAGLQRLMQALGAFGFLGHVKAKDEFLAHIPLGVIHLRRVLEQVDRLATELPAAASGRPWLPSAMPQLAKSLTAAERLLRT